MSIAPSVRAAFDTATQTLNIIESGLVDYGRVGVFNNRPFAFVYIMAFLVLEMLAGLEIYCMSEIFFFAEYSTNSRAAPVIRVGERVTLMQPRAELRDVSFA